MRFGVLGPLMVWDDEGKPIKVVETKVRALLADLLVHEGRAVSADRLVDDLWGAAPPGRPANALQAKVSQLRRAVGRDRVVYQAPGYRLLLNPGEVDAGRFHALVAEARTTGDPRARAELFDEALALWRGPAYADFADEEFVRPAAERLADQRLTVLEERAEARLDAGDHTLLAGELADLVARHPLRERLRAVQIRALYLAGRQSEALAAYAHLRDRLADELGVDPGPELTALHEAVLRQDASLAGARRPGGPARGARSDLPVPLTALIGRDPLLDDVVRLLRDNRLVTLTGPGGVGKTRLSVAAARVADAPDGVWMVELAGLRGDATDLLHVVASALGLRDATAEASTPAERLVATLRDRRVLLVLDNCEHVIDAVAELVAALLPAVPGMRVLATSREPLGLAGEVVSPVEPLGPDDAGRLFAERAAAAAPGFTLDETTRGPVADICRRLDGIPLALELAATRIRGLGVRELADRLESRFTLLMSGRRGAPERQRTLRATIDWSWDLLTAPERIVLRRLAVLGGGCTLEAAEAVCGEGGVVRAEVFDLVTRLVDRSLVVADDRPAGVRYRLLESVAAYAMERLREAGELAAVRERHLRHYLDLAERAEPRLRGPEQRMWLGRLEAEAVNLRAALEEAVSQASAGPGAASGEAVSRRAAEPRSAAREVVVRLATALAWWWLLSGRLNEGRRALSAAVAAVPDAAGLRLLHAAFTALTGDRPEPGSVPEPGTVRQPMIDDGGAAVRHGLAQWLYAYGLYHVGDPAASEEANEQALVLLANDRWGTAAALCLRATHALLRGDLTGLARHGERSAELFSGLGDRWGELQAMSPLATLAEIRGDYAKAARLQEDGLRIARELGLATEVAARYSGLGRLALLTGDWARAHDLHERARRQAAAQGHVYGEVHAMMGLALGARRSGDLDAAERQLIRLRDDFISAPAGRHLLRAELGFIAELRGNAEEAAAQHLRGLEIARSLGEPRAVALSLEGLAGAASLAGDPAGAERAALLLGAADAARRGVGAPLPDGERGDLDRITAAARAVLGEPAFQESFRRGGVLPLEEAVGLGARHPGAGPFDGRPTCQ